MNVVRSLRFVTTAVAVAAIPAIPSHSAFAQQRADTATAKIARLGAEPTSLTLKVGDVVPLKVNAYDAQGNMVAAQLRVSGPRGAVSVNDGQVKGLKAGKFEIVAMAMSESRAQLATLKIPVTITWPALSGVEITPEPGRLYAGVTLAHRARASHADESERRDAVFSWRSSNPAVATVDRFGNVTALKPGPVTITAQTEGMKADIQHAVTPNPVTSLAIEMTENSVRTGDVVHLKAVARRTGGGVVSDVPVTWSYTYTPDDTIAAPGATGVIDRGLFAAEVPGRYTLLATAGGVSARSVLDVQPRDVRRRINVTGRGGINNVHTSDLWPWTGKDGRDYALVGTWGGDGYAYIFDISDLSKPVKSDSVKIDARTINDVTVSPDGRFGVLSREGASNRVNGVVILDLANPAHPKIAATFDQELTGGVHNMFATNDHLFAISNGDKYVIVDVRDIYKPKYVSQYDHPDSRVHDVWVNNGIAYSSEWGTGVVAVDVGNGKWGGTIEKPKLIATFPTTSGATHEIFPYFQKNTGKVYLFLGDEIMSRQGRVWEGTSYLQNINAKGGPPQTSAGYTHIVDFTDPKNPKNIAKYHQEEFGSHDIVVEDDVMYQAYYDGGLRVVDVSGELVGNLAEQRREIAVFKPYDPDGYTANASFVMNAMPWKGHILFTDFNSGLWSAKLEPKQIIP
ncbi:MAG: Ig-like domain-containing protein [Gemmatimonadaceae bacterium]|nr:Ig-like domain-containing protein [Gemmatimonadaceae bacterium]MDQ3517731.1 Ig-like domain-containing protein [Gemmatimonadota bacterium]